MPARRRVGAVALGELGEAQLADPVGGLLGAQVGEALARVAHLGGEALERRRVGPGRRDHDALFVEASCEKAGIPPGVGPPTSAWWARLAAKPSSSPATKTGEIRVMSGRWVPPR